MENESCIKEIISNSLNQVRTIIDADTVVGKQIVTPSGTVIIPISKVSMGFASGGLDLPAKKGSEDTSKNFGGGGGTGVTVTPVGFLTVTPDGEVDMIPMVPEKLSPIEQVGDILNATPDIISRIKNIFWPDEKKDNEEAVAAVESELEEAYREKLAQEAAEAAEMAIDDTEKLLENDGKLTREEKKRLKKEAKELKKLQKNAPIVVESAEDAPSRLSGKRGKISEKTLESGRVQ